MNKPFSNKISNSYWIKLLGGCSLLASFGVIANSPPMPYFSMVNANTGLVGLGAFHKISVADVNGDGYPDLLMHKALNEISQNDSDVVNHQYLFLNVPGDDLNDPHSRKFVDYTTESGIRAKRNGVNTGRHSSFAVFADVDNDDDLDMFSGVFSADLERYKDRDDRNDLFLNDGHGHFTLVKNSIFYTEKLGAYSGLMNTAAATFLDYDLDSNVDLFIGNWRSSGTGTNPAVRNQLYRGNGKGLFSNVTEVTQISSGDLIPSYAVTAADWNGDGFMELYENDYCRGGWPNSSIHWKNNGNGTFSEVQDISRYGQYIAAPAAGPYNSCSFGSMPRDYDNDGDIDFFELIVHGLETGIHSTLLINNEGEFSWDFDAIKRPDDPKSNNYRDHYGSWFDIDNDGLADFVLSKCCPASSDPETLRSPNRLTIFRQLENHNLNIVTTEAGFGGLNTATTYAFHSVIPLDYDLDGDEDLLLGFADNNEIQLWRNNIGSLNNRLTLILKGAGKPGLSNRTAIGARVEISADGNKYTREIYAGNGQFGPQVPLSLTFGLGQASKIDNLKIRWPKKGLGMSEFSDVAINQFLTIEEISSGSTIGSIVGDSDSFHSGDAADKPFLSLRNQQMLYNLATQIGGQHPAANLDIGGGDRPVGWTHRFTLPSDARIISATIKLRLRGNNSLVSNDELLYEQTALDSPFLPFIALQDLNNGIRPATGQPLELTINLAKTPVRISCPECAAGANLNPFITSGKKPNGEYRNLLPLLYDSQFDLALGDDATVDYSELQIAYVLPNSAEGDLDGNGVINKNDIDIINQWVNTPAITDRLDPLDLDHDGKITVLDARKLVLLCTKGAGNYKHTKLG